MEQAGLAVSVDSAGNLFGRRGGGEVWIGSHLDSVPGGGRFDGALGVVAAIEVAERVQRPLAVVAFRDEERGCAGSRACVARAELPEAYLELHIEQGPVLERAGAPLGIVSADLRPGLRARSSSRAAPTTRGRRRWTSRDDALVAAAEFVLRVRSAAGGRSGGHGRASSASSRARATSSRRASRSRSTRARRTPLR